MAWEWTALTILGPTPCGWVLCALAPLFALGGIGMPALQSLTTRWVDRDSRGKLRGVLGSIFCLASVFGPLFVSAVYFALEPHGPRVAWIVGGAVYLLALPLLVGLKHKPSRSDAANAAGSG